MTGLNLIICGIQARPNGKSGRMNIAKEFWNGKKVLITGHTGFKGSWLCLMLHKMGSDVYGYSLEPPTVPSLYEDANINKLVTSFIGDIRDYEKLLHVVQTVKPEIVIHMAAQAIVKKSYKNPVDTYTINIIGTVNLLEAIRHTPGIKAVVNVTTDKCYENKEWHWGYREIDPMGGYDPYSNSKGCSELVTAAFRNSFFNEKDYIKHGVAIASARSGNVIGGGDWAEDRLVPDFMRAMSEDRKVLIRNPYAIRPWQYVLEPLRGYLMLATKLYNEGPKYGEAWNFGPNYEDIHNVEWMIRNICDLWGEGASYSIDTDKQPHEASYLKLDSSKSNVELGWVPQTTVEQCLKLTVDWYKYYKKSSANELCNSQINEFLRLEV